MAVDFKVVAFHAGGVREPKYEVLANELAAIANTRNGVLVFGVDDKMREIVGIPIEHLETVER